MSQLLGEMRVSAIRIPSTMARQRTLCRTFRSLKSIKNPRSKIPSISSPVSPSPIKLSTSQLPEPEAASNSDSRTWCVYLILSTNVPIKTYVGVTTDFTRRYVSWEPLNSPCFNFKFAFDLLNICCCSL